MHGFVAVTDPGWYERLSQLAGPRDANFWRPSARTFARLPVGTPFFFKLKAPFNAIAGFGYFAGFTILPDWLAWETFGDANGVESLTALRDRLARIQSGASIDADPTGRIGCCLLAESTFFARDAWVRTPSDWSPRTQTGGGYDLSVGEGLRIWTECLQRTPSRPRDPPGAAEPAPRYGTPTLHVPRLGQAIFRVRVLDAYDRGCAVTGEHSLPVLEAAHIKPYASGGEHAISNGLTLRSDLHRLFDRGYVTIDERGRFVVGGRLKADFENGRSYYCLQGHVVATPRDRALAPASEAIAWHREHVYLG